MDGGKTYTEDQLRATLLSLRNQYIELCNTQSFLEDRPNGFAYRCAKSILEFDLDRFILDVKATALTNPETKKPTTP